MSIRIQNPSLFVNTKKKEVSKDKPEVKFTSNPTKKMSYLDIPKVAFTGNNIIKRQNQEELKLKQLNSVPGLDVQKPSRFNLNKPVTAPTKQVQMFVYPQDPMISKPELMMISSVQGFKKGPEGDRIKVVDYGRDMAQPNVRGNFIYKENSAQFDQVNSFALVNKSLNLYQNILGRKIDWGFGRPKLALFPHAGNMMNAYYSRQDAAIKLFEFDRPDTGEKVTLCRSSDVVTHEAGHATLDGIKPHLLENFGFGVPAFHEAFADTTAMLVGLQNDGLINRMLEMTGGNLKKDNVIASLAEEFGDVIHKTDSDPTNDNLQYLRNAINNFKQKPYSEMPYYDRMNNDTVLGLECHSYGRLYLGAAYDVLAELYEKNKPEDANFAGQKFALMQARDTFANLFARAMDFAPAGEIDFKDVALATIKADIIDNKGENRAIIEKIMIERNIISADDIKKLDAEMASLPEIKLPDSLKTPADILQFVEDNKEELGLPKGLSFNEPEAYVNNRGEKHVVLTFNTPTIMSGPEFGRYQGQMVNIVGTVALGFNKDGTLINKTHKDIDEQTKKDVLLAISMMIKNMRAKEEEDGNDEMRTLETPQLLSTKSELGDFTQLVKPSIITDPYKSEERGLNSLGNYFSKLKAQQS